MIWLQNVANLQAHEPCTRHAGRDLEGPLRSASGTQERQGPHPGRTASLNCSQWSLGEEADKNVVELKQTRHV